MDMQTKKCKYCQCDIPKKAKICPNCKKSQGGKVKWIVIGIIILIILVIIPNSNSDKKAEKPSNSNPQKVDTVKETTTDSGKETSKQNNPSNVFVVGDVIETSDLRITYLSAEEFKSNNQFIQPKEGNVYYKMEFEFENIGKSDKSISSLVSWECYADGYKCDQTYYLGDDESSELDGTISAGRKVKGFIAFEVPENAEKVELEYDINYWQSNKIIFVVK